MVWGMVIKQQRFMMIFTYTYHIYIYISNSKCDIEKIYMRSSLNSFSRIRTKLTLTVYLQYLQDSAFEVQVSQQTLNMSEESCE